MPQQDIHALLAQVAPLSERKTEIENQINGLLEQKRDVDEEIKRLLTHVNALVYSDKSTATPASTPAPRGRRRGRNGMHNSMTLQSAITQILGNRAFWGAERATVAGLQTREIANAIQESQIWAPSNPSLFYSQVSQTISRMRKEGLVRQENDRRYALIEG